MSQTLRLPERANVHSVLSPLTNLWTLLEVNDTFAIEWNDNMERFRVSCLLCYWSDAALHNWDACVNRGVNHYAIAHRMFGGSKKAQGLIG